MARKRQPLTIADIPQDQARFLWAPRIPKGAITLLEGDPGDGKSTLVCDLIARVTNQRGMPFEAQRGVVLQPRVLMIQLEDDLGKVVRPNLIAAGARINRVVIPEWLATDQDIRRRRKRSAGTVPPSRTPTPDWPGIVADTLVASFFRHPRSASVAGI